MQTINISSKVFRSIAKNVSAKQYTVKLGNRKINNGPGVLVNSENGNQYLVLITGNHKCKVSELPLEVVKDEGYDDIPNFIKGFRKYYPSIEEESEVTVINYEQA